MHIDITEEVRTELCVTVISATVFSWSKKKEKLAWFWFDFSRVYQDFC